MRTSFLATLSVVLAFGCADQPTIPTAPSEAAPTTERQGRHNGHPDARIDVQLVASDPLSNFLNGPADPGPHIIRYQDVFVMVYLDPARSLLAVIGADTDDVCQGVFDFDIVDIQENLPPGDATRIMQLIHGDELIASVWEFSGTGGCPLFTTATPLVKGPVDLRNTDNDLLVFLDPDNRNANAFGFNVHGAFNGHSRCRWDGNDSATVKCSNVIIVKPG